MATVHGPLVSVVVPVQDGGNFLADCLDSVLRQTYAHFELVIFDDASRDDTVKLARGLDRVVVEVHPRNRGYGGNQKTCYRLALEAGADIVIMIHPDYQYTPKLIPAMVSLIGNGVHPCVLGSRILGGYSLKGGMPYWKYISNRFLTFAENVMLGAKLSEYHTGYRAFSREILEKIDTSHNSDDFIFDNRILAQPVAFEFSIVEISWSRTRPPRAKVLSPAESPRS